VTNGTISSNRRRGRQRPLQVLAALLFLGFFALGTTESASAHAEPERANPPINGAVPVAPAMVEIWFDEEVKSEGTTIQVIGPDGIQVDLGDATVDLQDPNRQHVTVSLRPGLGPGAYTVQWVSLSSADGDEARGGYLFRVGAASPVASPAVSPVAEPVEPAANASPTPVPNIAGQEGDFDSRAFGISVGVGVIAAILIYLFWRLVRPKNPKFRG
jgi:methionine-rich copper-binding protein CopC